MSYTIHNCHNWKWERLQPYAQDIQAAIDKIVGRFPDDVTYEELGREIASGARQLWLILDEEEKFKAFVTSEIEVTKRGRKRLLLLELAGDGGVELAEMIVPIEAWAREQGLHEICPIGRMGWIKAMKKHGFRPDVVKYRKEL